MTTTATLVLPVSGERDLASWAAVAFVACYSSPGTRQAYATQLRLWFDWCDQHHLEPLLGARSVEDAGVTLDWDAASAAICAV